MKKRTLHLTPEAHEALQHMRDCHPTPYLRERAGALLRIADGESVHHVARHGLLKPRKPDTVYSWLNAYEQKGLAGLVQQPRHHYRVPP